MHKSVASAATVLLLAGAVAAPLSPPITEGPPPGHTGGFGEPTCVVCHVGNAENGFGGEVRFAGLPPVYAPGDELLLTIVLAAEETEIAGFQVAARFAGGASIGRNAGTFVPIDARTAVTDSSHVSYIHQSRLGAATAQSSGSSWSFTWVAPDEREPVVFHIAANSGNGDNSPLGDLVFTNTAVVAARD
jgi:hypothetical protein